MFYYYFVLAFYTLNYTTINVIDSLKNIILELST